MRRADLYLRHVGGDDEPAFFSLAVAEMQVVLSPAELRWLVVAAGPAMLSTHAPLPTAPDIPGRARR